MIQHPTVYRPHDILSDIPYLSAAMSIVLLALIVILLVRYMHSYNLAERMGHGIAASAVFLSIFKLLGFVNLMAPFNDLYQLLWRIGWLLFLGGKLWRLEGHSRANRQAVRQAERHFAQKAMP